MADISALEYHRQQKRVALDEEKERQRLAEHYTRIAEGVLAREHQAEARDYATRAALHARFAAEIEAKDAEIARLETANARLASALASEAADGVLGQIRLTSAQLREADALLRRVANLVLTVHSTEGERVLADVDAYVARFPAS